MAEEVLEREELIRMGLVEANGEGGPQRMSVAPDLVGQLEEDAPRARLARPDRVATGYYRLWWRRSGGPPAR